MLVGEIKRVAPRGVVLLLGRGEVGVHDRPLEAERSGSDAASPPPPFGTSSGPFRDQFEALAPREKQPRNPQLRP